MLISESRWERAGHFCLNVPARVPNPSTQVKSEVTCNSAEVYILWNIFPTVSWIYLWLTSKWQKSESPFPKSNLFCLPRPQDCDEASAPTSGFVLTLPTQHKELAAPSKMFFPPLPHLHPLPTSPCTCHSCLLATFSCSPTRGPHAYPELCSEKPSKWLEIQLHRSFFLIMGARAYVTDLY